MTFGMRVRMWARQAPRGEVVATTLVAAALVAALVVVAIPGDDAADVVSSTEFPTALEGAAPTPGADGGDGGVSDRGAASGTLPVAPLDTALDALPGASGSGVGSPGAVPSREASHDSVPAGEASAASEPLTASDQGVTEETIKVGFLNVQIGGFDATGFALGFRDDLKEVQQALVDHVNEQGGVNGRRVIHVAADADPLSQTSMRQACIRMTDDEKVFVVFDQTATAGTALRCYVEKRTPNFNTNAGTVDAPFWSAAGGYLISGGAVVERQLLNWASIELANGVIGPGKGKLGILSEDCEPAARVVDSVLKPYLRQHGVQLTDERLSCDGGTAQQQVGAAALRLKSEGVNRVLLLALFTSSQSFVQQAELQGWVPDYSVTDTRGLSLDVTTQGFSPTAFDGTRGTTYGHSGEDRRGIPFSAGVKRCDEIIRAAGLPGITNQMGRDGLAVASCDHVFTWLEAMRRTPTNPTRSDVVRGVAQIGPFPLAAFPLKASYGPDKYAGADTWAVIQWSGDCRCWTQISDPQPGRF